MNGVRGFWNSLLGKKLIVAATGLILLLFLLAHMAGNLKALLGADAAGTPEIDIYAQFLRTVGEPLLPHESVLWLTRFILLGALILHVVTVFQLVAANQGARPIRYETYRTRVSTIPAKTMMVSGILILVFVVLHILHFTTGTIRLGQFEHGAVYANLYHSFRLPLVAVAYFFMMVVVGSHVWHGGWSFFQTWGFDNPARNRFWRGLAVLITLAIFVGFSLLPLLFVFGILPEPASLSAGSDRLGT